MPLSTVKMSPFFIFFVFFFFSTQVYFIQRNPVINQLKMCVHYVFFRLFHCRQSFTFPFSRIFFCWFYTVLRQYNTHHRKLIFFEFLRTQIYLSSNKKSFIVFWRRKFFHRFHFQSIHTFMINSNHIANKQNLCHFHSINIFRHKHLVLSQFESFMRKYWAEQWG